MTRPHPVHEIHLGAVRAEIWEDRRGNDVSYRVTLSRVARHGHGDFDSDRFEVDDLPLVSEVADLAHLWVCEQAELIA